MHSVVPTTARLVRADFERETTHMKRLLTSAVLAAAVVLPALPAPARAADVYNIDKGHSEVSFQIRHLVTNVRGRFNDFEGTVNLDPANMVGSTVEFKIKAASIDTGVADRDKHLRSADFFDTDKFPEITFKSKSIKATGKDQYAVTGTFTMHGVSKEVTLPVTFLGTAKDPWGGTRAGFETNATIDRKEYGIVWNKALDAGGTILSDEVKVAINLEAVKSQPKTGK
jgi:polyisoprenoid-binding protein YceI